MQSDYAGALEAYNSLELGAFERDEARNLHVRKAALRRIEEGEQVGVMMLELLTNPKLTQNQDDYLALTDTFVMQAPYDPLAWYLRGRCHQNRREMEMAVQNYEISLDLRSPLHQTHSKHCLQAPKLLVSPVFCKENRCVTCCF